MNRRFILVPRSFHLQNARISLLHLSTPLSLSLSPTLSLSLSVGVSLLLPDASMDYERIHKVQIGIISPSKLRMKFLGAQHVKRKAESCSSRAFPSKLEDTEYAKRNLLASDLDDEVDSKDSMILSINTKSHKTEFCNKELSRHGEGFQTQSCTVNFLSKGISEKKYASNQNNSAKSSYQPKLGNNYCTVHSMKGQEVEGNGYDSGYESANTSNFEFHGGGKAAQHPVVGPFSRHIPSKWNDAEKWLVNRQAVQEIGLKKNSVQYQCNRLVNSGWGRIAPESMITDQKPFVIHPSAKNYNSQNMAEKFSFVSEGLHATSGSSNDAGCISDPSQDAGVFASFCRPPKDLNHKKLSISESFPSGITDVSATKQLVSMRDVGTEMTPIPSQEPSRTATPIENLTPSLSPLSSVPSSPRIGSVAVDSMPSTDEIEKYYKKDGKKVEFSERELQLKTRQEIAALSVRLGKLNIASWASKETKQESQLNKFDDEGQVKQEYEACAAAWEEAEKFKQMSRYKREEIKIQVWESHQRAKYEARMRKVEIRALNMRYRAEAAMAEKLRAMEQRAEKKRANAEAMMNLKTARISQQAEQIRKTGRIPTHFRWRNWFL